MKAFNRTFRSIVIGLLAVFILCNGLFFYGMNQKSNKDYQVEINRLMYSYEKSFSEWEDKLEDNKICRLPVTYDQSLSKKSAPEYIKGAEFLSSNSGDRIVNDFFEGEPLKKNLSYLIRAYQNETGIVGYVRFWYSSSRFHDAAWTLIVFNVCFIIMSAVLCGLCQYFRRNMLKPFVMMQELPMELSKGHVTKELKENKNKYFGRFVWGLNLLKDTLDARKKREFELEREKKLMILTISHDIKTPLSSIRLYSKAIKEKLYTSSEQIVEAAAGIEDKTMQIENFVKEIVDMSTKELVNIPVVIGEFFLDDFVRQLSDYYSEKLSLLRIDYFVDAYENRLLSGDKERLIEVFENLFENVIKYGDGRWIRLSFSEEDYCQLITVSNSGIPMKSEELSHAFDSFWRGKNAVDKQGSGLGLYICREIIHRMEGEIYADKCEDGNAFTVVIPLV